MKTQPRRPRCRIALLATLSAVLVWPAQAHPILPDTAAPPIRSGPGDAAADRTDGGRIGPTDDTDRSGQDTGGQDTGTRPLTVSTVHLGATIAPPRFAALPAVHQRPAPGAPAAPSAAELLAFTNALNAQSLAALTDALVRPGMRPGRPAVLQSSRSRMYAALQRLARDSGTQAALNDLELIHRAGPSSARSRRLQPYDFEVDLSELPIYDVMAALVIEVADAGYAFLVVSHAAAPGIPVSVSGSPDSSAAYSPAPLAAPALAHASAHPPTYATTYAHAVLDEATGFRAIISRIHGFFSDWSTWRTLALIGLPLIVLGWMAGRGRAA